MKKIKGFLFVAGLIMIIGAAGGDQTGAIEFGQAMKQCLIGLPMMFFGVW